MKPEIITVTKRNGQGEKEKKRVWARSIIDCIFFSCYCIDSSSVDEEDGYVPARVPEQIQVCSCVNS